MNCAVPFLLFILLSSVTANGQSSAFKWNERRGNWYLGLNAAPTRYCGDLSERYAFGNLQLGWTFELNARYRLTEQLCVRSEIGFYHLKGNQQFTDNRDNHLSFSTVNPTLLVGFQWDIVAVDNPDIYDIPYVWAGFGLTHLNPTTTYQTVQYELAPLHTENIAYARFVGQLTYAVGVPLRISPSVQLRLEGRYTHILSDYVDDVSSMYANKTARPPLEQVLADRRIEYGLAANRVGMKRGNSLKNDGYFAAIVQLSVKLKAH